MALRLDELAEHSVDATTMGGGGAAPQALCFSGAP
jgi:hypothetical protein